MNLWELAENKKAFVQSVSGVMRKSHAMRLIELGLRENEEILCLRHTPFKGPRIYLIGDSVFSLAQDVAESVMISESLDSLPVNGFEKCISPS